MRVESMHFKARAHDALANPVLQANLAKFGSAGLAQLRARAVEAYGAEAFERLRTAGAEIRDRALADLDAYLERFEREATRRGATVLFAADGAEARDLVLEICAMHRIRKAIKSKSMLSEEAGLNEALAAAGVQPVETDLGEYIIQLAAEPPSHIIAPAVHKSKDEVADLFATSHGKPRKTDIAQMTREAREALRAHFLSADLGISGGNFLVAETGSGAVVTNEGNGRMVTTLPRVHVCITGIEKVIPTLEDFATLLRLLTRSATGQAISNYVSFFTGPRQAGDRELLRSTLSRGRALLSEHEIDAVAASPERAGQRHHHPLGAAAPEDPLETRRVGAGEQVADLPARGGVADREAHQPRAGGKAARAVVLEVAGGAEVDHGADPERAERREILLARRAEMPAAEEPPRAHAAPVARRIATEIAEVLRALEREQPLGHELLGAVRVDHGEKVALRRGQAGEPERLAPAPLGERVLAVDPIRRETREDAGAPAVRTVQHERVALPGDV